MGNSQGAKLKKVHYYVLSKIMCALRGPMKLCLDFNLNWFLTLKWPLNQNALGHSLSHSGINKTPLAQGLNSLIHISADREWVLYPGEPSVDATLRSNWKGLHKATAHSSEHWTFYPERYYGDATLKSTWNGIHKATAGSLEERHCK